MDSKFWLSIFLIVFCSMKLGGCFDRFHSNKIQVDEQTFKKMKYEREHIDYHTIKKITDSYKQSQKE